VRGRALLVGGGLQQAGFIANANQRATGSVVGVPAEFVGLNSGPIARDVIYELNGSRIAALDALRTALDRKTAGMPLRFLSSAPGS
jgi:hypothetical protein